MLAYLSAGTAAAPAADAAGGGESNYNWALMGEEEGERGKGAMMGEALIGGVLM